MGNHPSHLIRKLLSSHPKPLYPKTPPTHFPFSSLTNPNPTTNTKTKTFSHIYQVCSAQTCLNPGKQAHARMIVSGFVPTVFVSNCLIHLYVKCCRLDYARMVFDEMPERDVVSCNAIIFGYAARGQMGIARKVFDEMPERDVVSWNSMISGFLQNGSGMEAVCVFVEMGRLGFGFDRTTFAVVLKVCAGLEDSCFGGQVHGVVVRLGFDLDVVTGSALVDMYAKCWRLDESMRVFFEMPEKNWVSWSAVIAGCVQNDRYVDGVELFKEMQRVGIGVSQSIYASIFRACAGLSQLEVGSQLHGHAIKSDFGSDIIVGTATLDMYAKCGSTFDACKVFNHLPKRTLQSYNAIIIGYGRSDQGLEALQLFRNLHGSGLAFDEISLSGAFSACALIKGLLEGVQIHGLTIKSNNRFSVCVSNAIMDMYGKCGALVEASRMFDEMERRDAVSWNAIILAHEQNGNDEESLSIFSSMLRSKMEPDDFTYGSVLKSCADQQALNCGMEIHSRILKSGMGVDSFVGGALVDMYCKCGMIEEAEKIHSRTGQENLVSWNVIISGFTLLRQSEDAQSFFSRMLEMGVKPDNFTYATVLDSCANLATVGLGKQIHGQIIKQKLQSDAYISSTLVDMYSKCGNMQDAKLTFNRAPKKDFVTWNAMICGYAQHGLGEEALRTFETMQLQNVKPNHATFVSVLGASVHMGLVDEGLHYFDSMQREYSLFPQLEHYSCMVDLLGRSGRVSEALKLIQEMPFEPDDVLWRTLLSICKMHGNVEIAEKATSAILKLDPEDSSAYVLLSNIYANAGMWPKVSNIRKKMRGDKLKKEPGCSWIEVKDEMHTFLVGDKDHPMCKEIYYKLDFLTDEMKRGGYAPEIDYVLDDEVEEIEVIEEHRICLYYV